MRHGGCQNTVTQKEMLLPIHVDAHEAGVLDRRRRDAHVYGLGAHITQQLDDGTQRIAAHDRVIDEHDGLALEVLWQRVELDFHSLGSG